MGNKGFVTGQALVEYVLLLAFISILGGNLVAGFTNFMRDSVGNLGHVLSVNVTVGICQRDCFYDNYKNGFRR